MPLNETYLCADDTRRCSTAVPALRLGGHQANSACATALKTLFSLTASEFEDVDSQHTSNAVLHELTKKFCASARHRWQQTINATDTFTNVW